MEGSAHSQRFSLQMLPYDVSERAGTPVEPPAEAAFWPPPTSIPSKFPTRGRSYVWEPTHETRKPIAATSHQPLPRLLIQGLPLSCPNRELMLDYPKINF